jgi:hypothetical protein
VERTGPGAATHDADRRRVNPALRPRGRSARLAPGRRAGGMALRHHPLSPRLPTVPDHPVCRSAPAGGQPLTASHPTARGAPWCRRAGTPGWRWSCRSRPPPADASWSTAAGACSSRNCCRPAGAESSEASVRRGARHDRPASPQRAGDHWPPAGGACGPFGPP